MNRILMLTLAVVAGLFGSLLSRYVTLPSVHAQTQARNAVELRAQSFTLVDARGNVLGTFTTRSDQDPSLPLPLPPHVVLLDPLGREIWNVGGSKFKSLAQNPK